MKYLGGVLLAISLSAIAFAKNGSKQKLAEVKPVMHEILLEVQNLRPLMVSDEKFSDPKNDVKIKHHLESLAKHIRSLNHTQIGAQPGLKMTKEVLQKQIDETNRIFRVGNKSYARWSLNSTLAICMNCHTQAPSSSTNWGLILFDDNGSAFDKAEFLYAARNFDRALEAYDALIDGYPDNKISSSQLEKALERKVAIFAKTKRDFNGGIASLEKSEKNEKLSEYLRKNIKAWEGLFRLESKTAIPTVSKATDDDIKKYVEREMKRGLWDSMVEASNPRLVTNLTVSGVLYEYLNLHPQSAIKADLYYWLALCDRPLTNSMFYSFADIYLKACMDEFPKNPTAQKCYREYELNTILSYTGSSGTHLPDDVVQELRKYEKMVFGENE